MPDFRVIPSIDELRRRPAVRALEARVGATVVVDALRAAADAARRAIAEGGRSIASEEEAAAFIERAAAQRADAAFESALRPVINATGVVIHTNLGRAPLARAAIDRVAQIAAGYAALEYDLARGTRSRRDVHAEALLQRLTDRKSVV